MKITIQSTEQLVSVAGERMARVWLGITDGGIAVQLLVVSVAVPLTEDQRAFEAEFVSTTIAAAPEPRAFPLRMLL